jgi:hypothetical protein
MTFRKFYLPWVGAGVIAVRLLWQCPAAAAQAQPVTAGQFVAGSAQPAPPTAPVISNSPAPAQTAASMTPDQARAVLNELFLAEARVKDLLGTLQTTSWKMTDAERQEIDQTMASAQEKLQDLERWRYQLYYHLGDFAAAQKTQAAASGLQPLVAAIGAAAGQHQGAASARDFEQATQALAQAIDHLKPYASGLEVGMKATREPTAQGPGGGPKLQTEVIKPRPNVQPITSTVTQPPPLNPQQLKDLLYKVYVPAFRIKDLLSQEQPQQWKAPATVINAFNSSRQDLLASLRKLERWRGAFAVHPASLNTGFETYVAIDRVLEPLESVILGVAHYESPRLAAQYQQAGSDLRARQKDLIPYLNFLFNTHDQTVTTYQTDLVNCQNQLGYAMHGLRAQATPMKNVLPEFEGRNVQRRRAAAQAKAKRRSSIQRGSSRQSKKKRRHHAVHPAAGPSGK